MPIPTVVTQPVTLSIVATAPLLLLHVPPGVGSLRQLPKPIQIPSVPVIGPGLGFTVTVVNDIQPRGDDAMIVVVPFVLPVSIPVDEPMVATVVLLLLQVTPAVASVNAIVLPTHTAVGPVIAAVALMVT